MSAEELRKKINDAKKNMSNIEQIQLKDIELLNTVGNEGGFEVIEEREQFLKEYKEAIGKFKIKFNKASENTFKFALYFTKGIFNIKIVENSSDNNAGNDG